MFSFNSPYDQSSFLRFLERDFLPHDFREHHEEIDEFSGNRIQQAKQIGEVPSLDDLAVFEIHHESEHDPRVTLTRESFKLIDKYGVKNALAAFVSDNSDNYRFSLITSSLTLTDEGQAKRDFSNPRRYSFLLGPDAKVKTPKMYLREKGRVSDFEDLRERFDIRVLTKEFYNELSNWYFWALKNVKFPEGAEEQPGGKNMAVIRMITRLVFIWFMKERDLVPEHLFNEEDVQNTLTSVENDKSTYYKAILQNLFFATLNTPQDKRGFNGQREYHGKNKDFMNHSMYRYESFFENPDEILGIFQNIPFLNGGIFECLDSWEKEDGENKYMRIDGFSVRKENPLSVPNHLFFGNEREVDLNEDYGTSDKTYKVRGLVDILNDYNFTIDENTPIDQDVSLDPELLGHIFENLLASYNPETATTARKSTGSYYTPRPIVEFMTDISLKEYFLNQLKNTEEDTESLRDKVDDLLSYHVEGQDFNQVQVDKLIDAIDNLKIIDPAVGSGAFPMGVLQKLVLVLEKLDPEAKKWLERKLKQIQDPLVREKLKDQFEEKNWNYIRKLGLIRDSIYGVDIQPIAIQIAKLRFFISLLVDEEIDETKKNMGIEPLPNLETNFVAANSLVFSSTAKEKPTGLTSKKIDNLEKELRSIRTDYFNADTKQEKKSLREDDKNIREELLKKLKKAIPNKEKRYLEKLASWNPYDSNNSADFFDPLLMFGIKDFDIVIANPPYIGYKGHKEKFEPIKDSELGERFYYGLPNIYYFFFHLALDIANSSGIITFITLNYYITATYAKNLREDIKKRSNILSLVNFNELRIFESARGQHNMITILSRSESNRNTEANNILTHRQGVADKTTLRRIFDRQDTKTNYFQVSQDDLFYGDENYIRVKYKEISKILDKMAESSLSLGEEKVCKVRQGLRTGADEVTDQHLEYYEFESGRVGDGIFVLTHKELEDLNLNEKQKPLVKKWYKNSNIERFKTKKNTNEYLLYIDKDQTLKSLSNSYPNIYKHLKKYKSLLMDIRRRNNENTDEWFTLDRPREQSIFESDKLIAPQRAQVNTFSYSKEPFYASADVYYIVKENSKYDPSLKFILGLLNSKLYYQWFYHRGKRKGDALELYATPLKEVPVPEITNKKQAYVTKIERIVEQIIERKKQDQDTNTSALESKIDQLVYDIYDLTPEEVDIVENRSR